MLALPLMIILSIMLLTFSSVVTVKKPLQWPYNGPFRVISHSDKYFVLVLNDTRDTVSLDRLKSAHMERLIPSFKLPFVVQLRPLWSHC